MPGNGTRLLLGFGLGFGLLAVTLMGCGPGPEAPPAPPPEPASATMLEEGVTARSVLLVTVDTLRADAVGFSGNPRVATPVMDRLAAGGRVFPDAHAHSTMTLPSHTNILTGLLPYRHGVRDNGGFVLSEEVATLAQVLEAEGFATAAIVAAFPLDARFGLDRGFELYDDVISQSKEANPFALNERPGHEVVGRALGWWSEHSDRRRFLWVHLFEPHAPYEPPEPFASSYADRPYLGEVAATDAYLEPLLGPLIEAGAEAGTFVVLTADHGEGLGDHGELTHGLFAYESTLRVPLVLWGPGVTPGRDTRAARHVDILPTVLEITGLASSRQLDGVSLFAAAVADPASGSYFESLTGNLTRGWAPLRGLIRDGRKFIELPIPELYDLAEDPGETDNLMAVERRLAGQLRASLPDESVWPPAKGEVSAEVEDRLRALGYLGGSATDRVTFGPQDDPKNLIHLDRELLRGHELFASGRYEAAVTSARRILQERPTLSIAHEYLALSLIQLGRTEEAVQSMRRAREMDVARPALVRQLALTLTKTGRAAEAIPFLEEALARGTEDRAETLNALGTAQLGAGRPLEAAATLERVFESDPTNALAYENLSMVSQALGRWVEARDHALRALELDANRPDAWNNLGVAAAYLDDLDGAFEAWERGLALAPDHADALFNLGITAAGVGRVDPARRALGHFLEVAPRVGYETERRVAEETLAALRAAD